MKSTRQRKPRTRPEGVTQAEYAYDELKHMIMNGALPFGSQLLEAEAAERLGVSRTPVREAMIRLQQEGMVELRPRHGMRVLPVAAEDMRDIYDVLTALEGKAAELVASKSPEERDLSGMRDAVEQMESALAAGDLQAWAAADELFHARFIALTGNDRLVAMVNQLWDQAHRARMATLRLRPPPEQSNIEHRALVDSIARGDPAEARRVHEAHRHRAKELLVSILEDIGGSHV